MTLPLAEQEQRALIRPLGWLHPNVLLAALMRLPADADDRTGWINIAIRDGAHPAMPDVLAAAMLLRDLSNAYRILGTHHAHATPTPIVRMLCHDACARLRHELSHGHSVASVKAAPDPIAETKRKNYWSMSRLTDPRYRSRLLTAAVRVLEAIDQAPPGWLPVVENWDAFEPHDALLGWFWLPPPRPPRPPRSAAARTRVVEPAV